MEQVTLTIDGQTIRCPSETTILDAATARGIYIPTLCHHRDLRPFGACRICLVEEEKSGRVMASCVTPVSPDMTLVTGSPTLTRLRRNIVQLMMAEHPESCVVCSKGNQCELRRLAAELDVGPIDLRPMPHYKPLEQANPFIIRDLSKCILCGKCIRADHELVAVGAIDYHHRGFGSRPATLYDQGLEQSECTFCGTCVSVCPTGALSVKNPLWVGTAWDESVSVCGFCSVGCTIALGVAFDRVVEANPADLPGSVNGATLCVRGHFAHDFLNGPGRLTQPLIKQDGQWSAVPWEEAVKAVGDRLDRIRRKYGPQSIGMMGSSKCSNEENYLFQKVARVLIGTNNVDNGGYVGGRPVLARISERLGGRGRVQPLKALKDSEAILVVGADPGHSTPVVSYYIKRAAREGVPVIVANPVKTGLWPFAALQLQPRTQSDAEWINGVASLLASEEPSPTDEIRNGAGDLGEYLKDLADLDLDRVCRTSGLTHDEIGEAARLLRGRRASVVVGTGILQQRHGSRSLDALLNLSLMTGGGELDGWYVLERDNNSAGAWDMGTVPDQLPGRRPLGDDGVRKLWERAWQAPISPDPGLGIVEMIEAAEKGTIKALYVMGENPLRALPQSERVRRAFEQVDFVVVQDILFTETCEIADAVLPGAAFCEKEGSFTNLEGRIQKFRPAVAPPGEAEADWRILNRLAVQLGAPKGYGRLGEIRKEIAERVPGYKDVTGPEETVWIHEEPNGSIPFSRTLPLAEENPDPEFPLKALLVSRRFHLGSGTRTGHSSRVRTWAEGGAAEVHPDEGAGLKLAEGDAVRIRSAAGSVVRPVKLNPQLRPGLVLIPTGFHANDALSLIDFFPLGGSDAPGWKECGVRLERLGRDKGEIQ